jgi:hypothetical protein
VEQAFQACAEHHQKINGLQPRGTSVIRIRARRQPRRKPPQNLVIPNRAESPVRNLL